LKIYKEPNPKQFAIRVVAFGEKPNSQRTYRSWCLRLTKTVMLIFPTQGKQSSLLCNFFGETQSIGSLTLISYGNNHNRSSRQLKGFVRRVHGKGGKYDFSLIRMLMI